MKEFQKKEDPAKEVNQVDSNQGMDDDVLVAYNVSHYHHDWLLDSGASHHMYPHKSWFSSYQPLDGDDVLMGNELSCKTVGIDSIRIKMFDRVVRTLTEVRHVLDIKRNMISLGELDLHGYKHIGHEGFLKVSKGTLVVIKSLKKGNIYILVGSIDVS